MEEELQLIKRAQAGDNEAFGLLYDSYFEPIYRFIYYKVFSKEIAEDLTSDTFIKALSRIGSYKIDKGRFNSWLYQIARNTVIDYYRTRKEDVALEDIFDVPYDARTAEQFDALTALSSVDAYLKALPARQREIITLRIWEEKSFKEIADILGGTENSIKMAFSRSIRQLREVCGEAALLWLFVAATLPFAYDSYYIDI